MKRSRFTEQQIVFAMKQAETGVTVARFDLTSKTRRFRHFRVEALRDSVLCYGITFVIMDAMSRKLKITTVGNSAGVVLPREILERLRVEKGDALFVTETPDGIELRPFDDEFSEQMTVAERMMREDRDVLRKLAE